MWQNLLNATWMVDMSPCLLMKSIVKYNFLIPKKVISQQKYEYGWLITSKILCYTQLNMEKKLWEKDLPKQRNIHEKTLEKLTTHQ